MYSIGLAVRFWFQARQHSQRTGARPAENTSTLVQRFFNMLVVLLEIHPVVQAGHLVAVAVEHAGRPFAEFAQPPLTRLAPPWMVHLRIDVGVEPVLGRIRQIPRGGRLAADQADFDDRFDALEPVLPGQDHAHWRAILRRQRLAEHARAQQRQRMHGLVNAQAFHVGELQAGRVRHLLAVEKGLERHIFRLRRGLHLVEQRAQRISHPRHHNRPGFHAAMPVHPLLQRRQRQDLFHSELARLVAQAFHADRPGRGLEVLGVLRGVAFIRAELVVVVVRGDVLIGVLLLAHRVLALLHVGQFRPGQQLPRTQERGRHPGQKVAPVHVNMFRRDLGITDIGRLLDQHFFPSNCIPLGWRVIPAGCNLQVLRGSQFPAETQRRRVKRRENQTEDSQLCTTLTRSVRLISLPQTCSLRLSQRPCVSAGKTPPYGRRITFIRFASCRYSRSNHDAPSASGATALISGSTRIAPRDIISIHAGYSPFEAHDPCTRICRDTTDCSGSSIPGDTFPTRVTAPPLRTAAIAVRMGSVAPTHSHATSAPRPSVSARIAPTASVAFGLIASVAPAARASFSRPSSGSTTITRLHPAFRAACMVTRPIIPLPTTTAVSPSRTGVRFTAWTATLTASISTACSKLRFCGSRYTIRRGTATNSANAPWRRYGPGETPNTSRLSHRFCSPRTQKKQRPQ